MNIVLLVILSQSCKQGTDDKNLNKPETFKVYENSTFEIISDNRTLDQYLIKAGNKLVFAFQKQGVVFIDAYDYEPVFTEVLLFEIDPSEEKFEFTAKDLKDISCNYSFQVLAKTPQKENRKIERGVIKGHKIDANSWKISVNIDTDFKVGGYLEKQSSRKIQFEKIIKNNG